MPAGLWKLINYQNDWWYLYVFPVLSFPSGVNKLNPKPTRLCDDYINKNRRIKLGVERGNERKTAIWVRTRRPLHSHLYSETHIPQPVELRFTNITRGYYSKFQLNFRPLSPRKVNNYKHELHIHNRECEFFEKGRLKIEICLIMR